MKVSQVSQDSMVNQTLMSPSRRFRRLGWAVALLIVIGCVAVFWMRHERSVTVASEVLTLGPVRQVLALNGRVAPRHEVSLRAASTATILAVLVEEGDQVHAGDVLVELDRAQVNARLDQALAALGAQKVRERQAQVIADRTRALTRSSVSQASLEEAELTLEEARNETRRLEAAVAQIEREAEEYRLRAPIDATVLRRTAEPGQVATLQDELLVLANLYDPILRTDVDEIHSARVELGLPAMLLPIGQSQALPGRVSFAAPRIDTLTGARAIEISFDTPVALPIGLSVAVNLLVDEHEDALSVPRGALVIQNGQPHVLVVDDNVARLRKVEVDDWPAMRVRLLSGLTAGDRIILSPQSIEPGTRVTP